MKYRIESSKTAIITLIFWLDTCFFWLSAILYGLKMIAYLDSWPTKMRLFNESSKAFSTSLKIGPKNADTLYDLACVYLLMDKKEEGLSNLNRVINIKGSYKEKAKNDPDFKGLWDKEVSKRLFREILSTFILLIRI